MCDSTRHLPVLLDEVLQILEPAPGKVIVDLTLGGGGHSLAFLEAGAKVLAFDRDPQAIARTTNRLLPHKDNFQAFQGGFADFGRILQEGAFGQVDGLLMDLGLSSDQLDTAERGFAFRLEGPLDLRFDPTSQSPAWEILEQASEDDLWNWFKNLGELRHPRRVVQAVLQASSEKKLRTTQAMRTLIRSVVPPSTKVEGELARVFQALRIVVNEELEQLDSVLDQLDEHLKVGGRFVALSYHSLEDRRVKRYLQKSSGKLQGGSRHLPPIETFEATMKVLYRKGLKASDEEIQINPRARSARLRAGEKIL